MNNYEHLNTLGASADSQEYEHSLNKDSIITQKMHDKWERIQNILSMKKEKKARKTPKIARRPSEGRKPVEKFQFQEPIDNSEYKNNIQEYTSLKYERVNEVLSPEDAIFDFVKIIAEWWSVAGKYLRDEVEEFEWELNFENFKKILKKIDNDLEEYDREEYIRHNKHNYYHTWYIPKYHSYRAAGYEYTIDEENQTISIEYTTCNRTKIKTKLDFRSNNGKVAVSGKFSSVMRRISATGFEDDYYTKFKDIIPDFYVDGKEKFEKLISKSLYRDQYSITYENFGEIKDDDGNIEYHKPTIYISIYYDTFYWVGKELWLGDYPGYDWISISENDDFEAKLQEYITKTDELLKQKELIKLRNKYNIK